MIFSVHNKLDSIMSGAAVVLEGIGPILYYTGKSNKLLPFAQTQNVAIPTNGKNENNRYLIWKE